MSGQSWTPAPKAGIVPLHPMQFSMILGRSFAALRHNPKVLFGFAVVVQLVVTLAATAVITFTALAAFLRIESVSPNSPDFDAIVAGAVAWTAIVSFLVGLAAMALTAIVQAVVAASMGFATVGHKAKFREIWRRLRPAIWRLFGFAALSALFGFVLLALIFVLLFAFVSGMLGGSAAVAAAGVMITLLLGLATLPLVIWLSLKLLLVPSILVLEGARFRAALVRSWRLTRGRFWFIFGIIAIISVIMGIAAQVVSVPGTIIATLLGGVIAPTGDPNAEELVGYLVTMLITQVLVIVVQSIGVVVQCTASFLIYLDSRMRYEGLDQTLLRYVERRELGNSAELLGDPFEVDPNRAVAKGAQLTTSAYMPAPTYGPPPTFGPPPTYTPPPAETPTQLPGQWAAPGSEPK